MASQNSAVRILNTMPVRHGMQRWGQSNFDLIAPILHPGLHVEVLQFPEADLDEIVTEADCKHLTPGHTGWCVRMAPEFDAIVIGCLLEPGLDQLAPICPVPAIGQIEASLHLAASLGRRVAFVQADPAVNERVRRKVHEYGFGDRLADFFAVGARPLDYVAPDKRALIDRMCHTAEEAVAVGADVIVGYGGPDIFAAMRKRLPVPVISPLQAGIQFAELRVRAGRVAGH